MRHHECAQRIFEDIRDRPYRVALTPDLPADNCYYKGIELIKELTPLGYAMRARCGTVDWRDLDMIPHYIFEFYCEKTNIAHTHFYPEICLDGRWLILDPSWNKTFAEEYGLPYSQFGADNISCFNIHKLFSQEEQIAYTAQCLNHDESEIYFKEMERFYTEINHWLKQHNP